MVILIVSSIKVFIFGTYEAWSLTRASNSVKPCVRSGICLACHKKSWQNALIFIGPTSAELSVENETSAF